MLLAQLPWRMQMWLGRGLGAVFHRVMRTRRAVAATNIALCFPNLSEAEQKKLVRDHFSALGCGMFEFMRAWWGRLGSLAPHVAFHGQEVLQTLEQQGEPVLLISGHFTSFEMCGRILSERHPTAAMYRPHEQLPLDYAVHQGRGRYANALFTRDQLRQALRFLKRGGRLWYAPDQDMIGKETVFAPFFGVPANTITATAQMARVTGAKVVPFGLKRTAKGYEIEIGEPLQDFPTDDPVADATRVNQMLESLVLKAPEQYFWLHRRFKRRPDGLPSPYAKNHKKT